MTMATMATKRYNPKDDITQVSVRALLHEKSGVCTFEAVRATVKRAKEISNNNSGLTIGDVELHLIGYGAGYQQALFDGLKKK